MGVRLISLGTGGGVGSSFLEPQMLLCERLIVRFTKVSFIGISMDGSVALLCLSFSLPFFAFIPHLYFKSPRWRECGLFLHFISTIALWSTLLVCGCANQIRKEMVKNIRGIPNRNVYCETANKSISWKLLESMLLSWNPGATLE